MSRHYRLESVLASLNDVVEGSETVALRVVARPVIYSDQVDLVDLLNEGYVFLKLGVIWWVVVI